MSRVSSSSDEPFRLLVEAVADYAIYMLDPEGRVVTWNVGAERIKGYSAEEIIGQHLSCFFPSEDVAALKPQRILERVAETGRFKGENWLLRKNGTQFWAHMLVTALHGEAGRLRGFAVITQDLTKRRRSEILLRAILDNTIDGIISIDPRGRIENFNRAAERTFGYLEPEVMGRDVTMLVPEGDRARHANAVMSYLETGAPRITGAGHVVVGLRKNGSTFPMELSVAEFELEHARHFTVMIRDLSERKRLEKQLHQSQKMEAVGQLAGGVAHDFNNLLTIIAAHVDLVLARVPLSDPTHSSLVEVIHAVERAAGLTRQLLAFSSQQVLEPMVLDLNGVVRNIEKMLRRLIGEDVMLATSLSPDLEAVKADPGQIEQVIVNLAVNARDAMPQGGKLTIETRNTIVADDDAGVVPDCIPGEYVQLSICDTGHGMSDDVRRHVFEPFFTTKPPGKGTGLGLATVYGIVRQSGGWIDIETEVGAGTTFKIYLPAVAEALEEQPEVASQPERGGGFETILLVEDEQSLRDVMEKALVSYGYNVLCAGSGAEALRQAERHMGSIDLLVTDVVMPEMSGRELAERLQGSKPGIRVLFISGYTAEAVVRHGVLQAEMPFLQKPFGPSTLVRRIREVLDERGDAGRGRA